MNNINENENVNIQFITFLDIIKIKHFNSKFINFKFVGNYNLIKFVGMIIS